MRSNPGMVADLVARCVASSVEVESAISTFSLDDTITIKMNDGLSYTLKVDGPHVPASEPGGEIWT